tara:strand:+ start:217 stop:909 length:693 start_codon:yes stop_codon:yes gene_type:complete
MLKTAILYNYSSDNIDNIKLVFEFIYNIFFFMILFFNILSVTENDLICGDKNHNAAFYSTIIPFTFIYGIGFLFITIFPGWIRCFSNTFGSYILNLIGLEESIKKSIMGETTERGHVDRKEIEKIFITSPKIILNELEMNDNNSVDITHLEEVGIKPINPGDEKNIQKLLKQYINSKESIGQGIWYLLLGIVTIMMSYNTILSEKCNAFENDKDKFKDYITDKFNAVTKT